MQRNLGSMMKKKRIHTAFETEIIEIEMGNLTTFKRFRVFMIKFHKSFRNLSNFLSPNFQIFVIPLKFLKFHRPNVIIERVPPKILKN